MAEMNDLVKRLTVKQAVVAHGGPKGTAAGFKDAIDRGFVLIKFTGTKGGTELGVRLDPQHTDVSGADFAAGTGKVVVGGELTLDDEHVRLHAEIDLGTLAGEGYLEYLGPAEEAEQRKGQEAQGEQEAQRAQRAQRAQGD
jgi:hypothetical protein